MKKLLFIFSLISVSSIFGQTLNEIINSEAVSLDDSIGLKNKIYSLLENSKLIMVGEMHGTKEPAAMVQSMAESILEFENSVSIGLEILPDLMQNNKLSDSISLLETDYFQSPNTDGRRSRAWFELVLMASKNSKINLFFFDAIGAQRDSLMYENIRLQRTINPQNKIITLSGNYHSRLKPVGGIKTMGVFASADSFYKSKELLSVMHFYGEGTMINNRGNGLELFEVKFQKSALNNGVKMENYLLYLETLTMDYLNVFFYTKKVTASRSVK